ncbi:MAG: hypothetical protein ABI867_08550 [Kofleriaceae bacterium]
MIVLTALAALGGLTVVSVQGGIATSGNDRFHTIAVYAAESGGAVAMDYLRKNVNGSTGWTAFVSANNANPIQPPIPGNNALYAAPGNLFSSDIRGSYSVAVLNNKSDPGFGLAKDMDARVIIRSTGYGPNGAIAVIEWEITAANITGLGRPCPQYAQKGISEDGAGRNDCLGVINTGDTAIVRPGG